jgi:hypothetical protein
LACQLPGTVLQCTCCCTISHGISRARTGSAALVQHTSVHACDTTLTSVPHAAASPTVHRSTGHFCLCRTQVALHECDVCFISYELLRKELRSQRDHLLRHYGFWRLMLDEAQLVASSNSAAAAAASDVWRFQVRGTAGAVAAGAAGHGQWLGVVLHQLQPCLPHRLL